MTERRKMLDILVLVALIMIVGLYISLEVVLPYDAERISNLCVQSGLEGVDAGYNIGI